MRAMVLDKPGQPLQLRDVGKPRPAKGQLLVRIATCAVCRTDLHVADGELPDPKLPLIPGHQIVGHVEEIGEEVNSQFKFKLRIYFFSNLFHMANNLVTWYERQFGIR